MFFCGKHCMVFQCFPFILITNVTECGYPIRRRQYYCERVLSVCCLVLKFICGDCVHCVHEYIYIFFHIYISFLSLSIPACACTLGHTARRR
uniref:Putative secreted peptide n=1 Tax=Anopheles braziliensis TaxID=58242 RepID=A0A2M3ZQ54_9DIPT